MKIYINCYVWGDGYTTKCFEPETRKAAVGSHTMGVQERTLFIRSNARLLLASVGTGHFGFVRKIDARTTDENGRKCMINFALSGTGDEVDAIIEMAVERYREFEEKVRDMVYYEGAEFQLDWEKFQMLSGMAGKRKQSGVSPKPVLLLLAEPSLDYFIKNCGMGWKEADIGVQLDAGCFDERSLGMKLYLYCATPSMGYMLREVDSETGSILHEERETREKIDRNLLAMLDNAGCRMALFHTGNKQCFVAKDVKTESLDRYGQRKTVCLAAESDGDERSLRSMALRALLDYKAFCTKLTDCVRILASTEGYAVEKDKLKDFLEFSREPAHQEQTDALRVPWNTLMEERKKAYTFLVMDTSLDYLCRSTGLAIPEQQVFCICPESILGAPAGKIAEAFRKRTGTAGEKEGREKVEKKSDEEQPERRTSTGKRTKRTMQEDAVDLMEYPAFKIVLGIFALMIGAAGIILYRILSR